MSEAEIVAVIERIFNDTLNITPPAPEVDIIDAALLDSLGLVTLLFEIEQELAVQIPLESLEVDDFRSIGLISRLIVRIQDEESTGRDSAADGGVSSRAEDEPVSADGKGAPHR